MMPQDEQAREKTDEKPARRWGKTRGLGAIMPSVTKDALARRGFVQGEIIARWREIVGARLADHTAPEKLAFPRGERMSATLLVRVSPGLAPELQHESPRVIERMNTYFGYRAIAALKLIQAPLQPRPALARRKRRKLSDAEVSDIRKEVAPTRDPDLRSALERFGRSLRAASDENQ